MRPRYFVFLLILSCSFSPDVNLVNEQLNQFNILFSKRDPNIKRNESRIEFQVGTNRGMIVLDSVVMSYNGIKAILHPDSAGIAYLNLPAGKYAFQFFLNTWHQEIYADSTVILGGHLTEIQLVFESVLIEVRPAKPVIYLYPETTQTVTVNLDVHGQLGFTYPAYNEGWNFIAQPDGKIQMNGREYDYLFWDGVSQIDSRIGEWSLGYIVSKDSLTQFFEEKLTAMGLNEREIEDYITYWCPLMQVNKYSYVHFLLNDDCNLIANMNIAPEPKNTNRVYMLWADATEINRNAIHPQNIPRFDRSGFDVLEWRGAESQQMSKDL